MPVSRHCVLIDGASRAEGKANLEELLWRRDFRHGAGADRRRHDVPARLDVEEFAAVAAPQRKRSAVCGDASLAARGRVVLQEYFPPALLIGVIGDVPAVRRDSPVDLMPRSFNQLLRATAGTDDGDIARAWRPRGEHDDFRRAAPLAYPVVRPLIRRVFQKLKRLPAA